MTSTRKFRCDDLFRFNNVNLDVLTETVRAALHPLGCVSALGCVLTLASVVQHVVLPAVSVQVAGLLPRAGGPEPDHHGLQYVCLIGRSLALVEAAVTHNAS